MVKHLTLIVWAKCSTSIPTSTKTYIMFGITHSLILTERGTREDSIPMGSAKEWKVQTKTCGTMFHNLEVEMNTFPHFPPPKSTIRMSERRQEPKQL